MAATAAAEAPTTRHQRPRPMLPLRVVARFRPPPPASHRNRAILCANRPPWQLNRWGRARRSTYRQRAETVALRRREEQAPGGGVGPARGREALVGLEGHEAARRLAPE